MEAFLLKTSLHVLINLQEGEEGHGRRKFLARGSVLRTDTWLNYWWRKAAGGMCGCLGGCGSLTCPCAEGRLAR